MLTEPTFSFTIPSIHDDILLSCRIYNPPHSVLDPVDSSLIWVPRGAVVAHPYAPLGGCYDDAVVLSAAAEILKQGFVVGTFNFRWGQRLVNVPYIDISIEVLAHQKAELVGKPRPKSTIISRSWDSWYII